jgi:hypothetical protein
LIGQSSHLVRVSVVSSAAEGQAALHNANVGAIESIMRRGYLPGVFSSGVFKACYDQEEYEESVCPHTVSCLDIEVEYSSIMHVPRKACACNPWHCFNRPGVQARGRVAVNLRAGNVLVMQPVGGLPLRQTTNAAR